MFEYLLTGYEGKLLIGIVLSLVAGTLIGIERELRGKEAGIRTHIFVIAGSMLFSFMSGIVEPTAAGRIASNIVIGIGFLGAGIILREHNKIINLTTAANIWFAAGIGMAIGFQFYLIAVIATVLALIVPWIPGIKH